MATFKLPARRVAPVATIVSFLAGFGAIGPGCGQADPGVVATGPASSIFELTSATGAPCGSSCGPNCSIACDSSGVHCQCDSCDTVCKPGLACTLPCDEAGNLTNCGGAGKACDATNKPPCVARCTTAIACDTYCVDNNGNDSNCGDWGICKSPTPFCGDNVCTAGVEDCGLCPGDCPCSGGQACIGHQCQAVTTCTRTTRAGLSSVAGTVLSRIEANAAALANSPVTSDRILSTCNKFGGARVDGPNIFRAARDIISQADHEVDIAFYKADADSQATALIGDGLIAAQVRRTADDPLLVRMVIDDVEADLSRTINNLYDSKKSWVDRGLDTGRVKIQLGTSPRGTAIAPNLHDKIVVVDGRQVVVTGSQPEKSSDVATPAYTSGWHDTGYVFAGDAAESALLDFDHTWTGDAIHWDCQPRPVILDCQKLDQHLPQPKRAWLAPFGTQRFGDVPVLAVGRIKEDILHNNTNSPEAIAWLTAMEKATSHIDVETPNINDDAFRDAVVSAVGRGVTVRLITSMGFNDSTENFVGGDNQAVVGDLRQRIRSGFPNQQQLFQMKWYSRDRLEPMKGNGTGASHTKYMTTDDRIAVVGSGNQDTASWNNSHEYNVLVDDAAATLSIQNAVFNPDWSAAIGSYIEFYEGNRGTQTMLCAIGAVQNEAVPFNEPTLGGDFKCNNDEARSVLLHDVPAGRVLRVYDDGLGQFENDDWSEIIVKRTVSRKYVDSFETSFEDDDVRVIYHRNDGLDGKVSWADVTTAPLGATVDFYEGNDATQNLVCSTGARSTATIDFTSEQHCANDEARALVLHDFPQDKVVFVYDDSGGDTGDDWALIVPKRPVREAVVGTFESSFETVDYRVCSFPRDGLDGKVSRIRIGDISEAAGLCGLPVTPPTADAKFTAQNVPSPMIAGKTYPVRLTVSNTGTLDWAPALVAIGSQNPPDNANWGLSRVALPSTVRAGESVTVPFTVTAPVTPKTYHFQWQMVQGSSNWFGAPSPDLQVTVTAAQPPDSKGDVLYLMGDAANMSAGDAAAVSRLGTLGFTVTPVDACSATAGKAASRALIVVGGTIPVGACGDAIGTTFQSVAVPALVSKAAMLPKMLMTSAGNNSGWGSVANQSQVAMVDPASPLAAGLSGTIAVETAVMPWFAWGHGNANAVIGAIIVGASGQHTLFGYPKDVLMPGGYAPACRVGAFWGDNDPASFTANGWKLFDAGVTWATRPACR